MPEMPIFLTDWLLHYGQYALFVFLALGIIGLPIPDETLLAFAGYLIARDKLPFVPTITLAILGAVVGISISYFLGRTVGRYLVEKYGARIGITHDKIQRVHNWFEYIGKWTLFFGYFIPGVRHLTGYVAGTTEVHFAKFGFFAYSGATIWCLAFIWLGYYFSNNWEAVTDLVADYLWMAVGIVVLIIVCYLLWLMIKKHYRTK